MKIRISSVANVLLYSTMLAYIFNIGVMKYIVAYASIFALALLYVLALKTKGTTRVSVEENNIVFYHGIKYIGGAILALCLITFGLQIINGYNSYGLKEAIYFATPLGVVFLYLQNCRPGDADKVLDNIFIIYVLKFVIRNIGTWSLAGIRSISFVDSYSPYENGISIVCVIYMFYFIHKRRYIMQMICLIISYIALKRFAFITGVVLIVFNSIIRKRDNGVTVSPKIQKAIIIGFIALPLVTNAIITDEFETIFQALTGIDIGVFTKGRFERLILVTNADNVNQGLGSTTTFLTSYFVDFYKGTESTNFNLHNDIYRIYIECGIIGTIAFTWGYFKAAAGKILPLLLMIYLFLEMYVNHLLGAGTVIIWIISYLVFYSCGQDDNVGVERRKIWFKF